MDSKSRAFFAVFLAIGFGVLGFAGHAWWKSQEVERWPATQGRLLERSLEKNGYSDGSTYLVKVRYGYSVAGRRYESDRIAFGYVRSSGLDSHRAIYEKLMLGDSVRVRYNPDDPAEATLAYGLNKSILTLLIFGAIWTVFTLRDMPSEAAPAYGFNKSIMTRLVSGAIRAIFILGALLVIGLSASRDTALIERLIVQ
ncbi:MAG: DUF3592 domain-containing protein [Lysobacter sp.]|nr:DUF3592 domain-containing protein [Lysobacter sp.]